VRHQPSAVGLLSSLAMVRHGLGITVTAMLVSLVGAPLIGASTQAQPPLVVAKAPLGQTVQHLLDGKFVETVSCRRACTMTTSAVIRPRTARRLGFKGVVAGQWVEIGTAKAVLKAKRLTRVRIRLNAQARLRLPQVKTDLQVLGRVKATSTQSPLVSGSAGWFVTCSHR
jgi:hypothetical protein